MLIKDIINYLESRFPRELAEDFDQLRIGLVIGSGNIEVKKVLLTLDLTYEVVEEAVKLGCNFIISHHPYLFDPLYKIDFESDKGRTIRKMFEHNISLYAMHTNLDVGCGGVNDTLAKKLFLKEINIINNEIGKGNYLRYGNIEESSLNDYALKIKDSFNLTGVKVIGDLNKKVTKAGIVGGSGAHFSDILNALSVGCDCYITGEVKLNIAQHAVVNGLSIIEVNHGIEKEVFYELQKELSKKFNIDFIVSEIETDPGIIVK